MRVYSVGLEPAAMNVAGSAVARVPVPLRRRSSSSWTVVLPTQVPKHRAQCASDGRRARRLAEIRAEPLPALLLAGATQLRTAGRNEQTSCQSRPAAARPAARKQLLLPPRCRRASTSSRASARARPPSRSRAQTSLPTAASARRGALSNTKNNNV